MLNGATASKSGKLVGYRQPPESVGMMEPSSEIKSTNVTAVKKKSSNNKNWGLIFKKNNNEETGIDFRLKNIILRGNPDMDSTKPVCRLCGLDYDANFMYIRCEACKRKQISYLISFSVIVVFPFLLVELSRAY